MLIDRDYQVAAVDAIIRSLKDNKMPVVSAATGTGKSVIIARLIQRLLVPKPDLRVIVATHVEELVEQNARKFFSLMPNIGIGIYSAGLGKKEVHRQITFAGIQSIYKATPGLVHLLIVDEAHTISRNSTSMWQTLIQKLRAANPNLKIVGLSATAFRMDSGSLISGEDSIFNDLCFDYGLGRGVQDGWLVPLVPKHTKTQYDVSKVGKVAGEFNLKELEAATNIDMLTRSAVDEMIEAGKYRKKWLIFCNGVAHSFAIRDELVRRGLICETVCGETDDNTRTDILKRFRDIGDDLLAVTNNAVWTTGLDVPIIDMIVMLRHTLSGGLLQQMAGRGTRPVIDLSECKTSKERRDAIANSSKPNCLFLDFAGNIYRHGFLDQIKGKEKKKSGDGIPPMKFCPECANICHAATKKCECGYIYPQNDKQIMDGLYTGSILAVDQKPEWHDVTSIEYYAHNTEREGKIPSLRVKYYHPNREPSNEYICLEHEGYAKTRAMTWWKNRKGNDVEGMSVMLIMKMGICGSLMSPSRIRLVKDGKYTRIVDYDFSSPQRNVEFRTSSALDDMVDLT